MTVFKSKLTHRDAVAKLDLAPNTTALRKCHQGTKFGIVGTQYVGTIPFFQPCENELVRLCEAGVVA